MIHIGDRKTLMTDCGKPVARRWWMEKATMAKIVFGPVVAVRMIHTRPEAISCPACKAGL